MEQSIDNREAISKEGDYVHSEGEHSNKIAESAEMLQDYSPQRMSLKIAILAIFTALGPVLSISFIWVPYFELMTLTIFLGGITLGPLFGAIQAIFSTTLYEIIASAFLGVGLPIFPFKILGFLLVGICGGILGKMFQIKTSFSWRIFIAIIGGLLTLSYDLLVNIGMIIFLDLHFISYFATLAIGLPVTAIRVTSNTIFFAFVPEIMNRAIKPALDNISFNKNRTSTNLEK